MKCSLFLVVCSFLLLMTCSQQPLPAQPLGDNSKIQLLVAPILHGAVPLKLGAVTKRALTIQSGHVLFTGTGNRVCFDLGHQNNSLLAVRFSGIDLDSVQLKAGMWQSFQGVTRAEQITIHFEGGPLFLSQPYLYEVSSVRVPPNILLISVDTLRRDHFSAQHMPRVHALFEKGLIFDDVFTPSSWTLPAHASLLSSLYPAAHGVRTPKLKLAEPILTLAEHLRGIGYYTAAFTEGNYVSASFGLDQGFLHYHENPPAILGLAPDQVSKLAGTLAAMRAHQQWLGQVPAFYFLHTYEVHSPYLPRAGLSDPQGLGGTQWLLDHDGQALSEAQLSLLKELYAGEVAFTDDLLADAIEPLLAQGNWLIVLCADHGEEFGEHGGLLHAHTAYQETTAVPLAFAGAGLGNGPLLGAPASLIDVAPTLLGLAALPVPDAFQGRDLLATTAEVRPVFSESFFFGSHLPVQDPMVAAIWHDRHKLVHARNFNNSEVALFQLETDPAELVNLMQDRVRVRNALFSLLKAYLSLTPGDAAKVDGLTDEQIEVMRSLGYLK